ncbi:hypothetical protein J4468_03060 [Candidatus Woesearchaeota archaeon]|nr:hypothetical protein [Candidatus Woesearchaeota archaeon]
MMGKRGQVYILAAVIMAVILVTLTASPNTLYEKKVTGDFKVISENYANEGSRLINSLLYNQDQQRVLDEFGGFTIWFTSYSKTKNSNLGLFYVITVGDTTLVGNYLDMPIIIRGIGEGGSDIEVMGCFEVVPTMVSFEGLSLMPDNINLEQIEDCTFQMPKRDSLLISMNDIDYRMQILEGKPQLLVVTQEDRASDRQVFVGGETASVTQMECTSDEDCINSQLCTIYDRCKCTAGNICAALLCTDDSDCTSCSDDIGETAKSTDCTEQNTYCQLTQKCNCLSFGNYGICTDKENANELNAAYSSNGLEGSTSFIIPQCSNDEECNEKGYCTYGMCTCSETEVCVANGKLFAFDRNI